MLLPQENAPDLDLSADDMVSEGAPIYDSREDEDKDDAHESETGRHSRRPGTSPLASSSEQQTQKNVLGAL